MLHPEVCDDTHDGLLAVHSLSKRSNLAGYRCGFVAGDPAVVAELLAVRKNLGLMMPGPQQVAMAAALGRRRARRPAARPLRGTTDAAARCPRGGRLPDRPLRGLPLPLGHPRPGLLGHRRRARRASGSSSPPAPSTGRPADVTSGSPSPPPTSASPRRPVDWRRWPDSAPACGWPATSSQTGHRRWWPRCSKSIVSKRKSPRTGWPHSVRSEPWSTAWPHFSGTRWAPGETWLPARYAAGSTIRETRSDATTQPPTGWNLTREHERQAS